MTTAAMTNSHLQLLQIIRMILTRSQMKEKLMNKNLVHTNSFCVSHSLLIWHNAEHLQMNWHSPMYGFFKTKVVIGFNAGCKYHFFKCTAQKCRGRVRRVFVIIRTQRIMPISRAMWSSALAVMLLMLLLQTHSLVDTMDPSLQCLLVKVNNLSRFLIVFTLPRSLGVHYICISLYSVMKL